MKLTKMTGRRLPPQFLDFGYSPSVACTVRLYMAYVQLMHSPSMAYVWPYISPTFIYAKLPCLGFWACSSGTMLAIILPEVYRQSLIFSMYHFMLGVHICMMALEGNWEASMLYTLGKLKMTCCLHKLCCKVWLNVKCYLFFSDRLFIGFQ